MKKFQTLSFLATLAIVIGMISWGSALHAQTSTTDQQTQQPTSTPPDATTPSQPPTPEMSPQSQQTPNADTPRSQQPPSQTQDTSTPESGSKSNTSTGATAGATDSQTFSGTVMKQGDKYVLKDDTGQVYDIDHQTDVAKFDGKRVRVQGTLDPSGKKILVK